MFRHDNPPKVCRNGHRLSGNRVLVDSVRCSCKHAVRRVHLSWTCRVCSDTIIDGGHSDDSLLDQPMPALLPSLRIPAEEK